MDTKFGEAIDLYLPDYFLSLHLSFLIQNKDMGPVLESKEKQF